ncbi:MAG: phenylalanine--tRNA ligase subunit beta [Pseudomonadota bacterium]
MKFTLSWLKSHLETTASVDEIAEALTDLGLEVEEIVNPMDKLAAFTVGYVTRAEKHPDADKLRVCCVDTDEGELQIICGAPNAREGIHVVVAKPGVYVPGIDKTIGVGKIRGVESYGMMCSEREMQLSDEHDGIIELDGTPKVGSRFVDYLATRSPDQIDPVIEIAITPNRPDALGVRGIARDLAARGVGVLKDRELDAPIEGSFPCPISVTIDKDTLDQCPVFYGRVIKDVKNGPSPAWLQAQLKAIGLRPISFLVDVTNFFTYDNNRPLHVFDIDKIAGGTLRVHKAKGGEAFVALDDKTYTMAEGMTLISDANGVESLGGVMGGLHSGCTEETVNVFVEAAYFDTVRTAYTGRALKINSDARYRFERGIDPAWTPIGLDHATRMIMDHAGGEASEVVVAGAMPYVSRSYKLDTARIQSLVGMSLPANEQVKSLEALGFEIKGDQAHVPSWRPDVMGEADLVEEVARIASLTKLKGVPLPPTKEGVARPVLTPLQKREGAGRRSLAALGYHECVTYSFIDQKSATLFGGGSDAALLGNPISQDMSHMRPSLLPGLLLAAGRNQARGVQDLALFEIGPVFHGGEPEDQELLATGLMVGQSEPRNAFGRRRPVDVFDAKADAEAILAAMGAPAKMMVQQGAKSWWHPGRAGRFSLGPKTILCAFGEIHPKILDAMDVKGPAVGFAIHVARIPFPKAKGTTRPALEISDYQTVERDFSFMVDTRVAALDVINAALSADKTLIADASVFDIFEGEKAEAQMGEGKKSVAISIKLEPKDKTLIDEEIEAVARKVIDKVKIATGGELRK